MSTARTLSTLLALAATACSSGSTPVVPKDGAPLRHDSRPPGTDQPPPTPDRSVADTLKRAGWKVSVVDDSPKFKSRVSIAVDPAGTPHLVYNIASSDDGWSKPDVWHAAPSGSAWDHAKIAPANGISNEFPSVVCDSQGKLHVVYNRYDPTDNQIDLFYLKSDDGKTFSAQGQNLTSTKDADEFAAAIAVDSQGVLHVIAQRGTAKPFSVGYLSVAAGAPSAQETVASDTAQLSLNPGHALTVDASGTVHVVYTRPAQNPLLSALYLKRRKGGTWSDELAVTDAKLDAWDPCVGIDGKGVLHVGYTIGADWDHKTLTHKRLQGTTALSETALTTSTADRSYYLGLAMGPDGTVHLGFPRYYPGPSATVQYADVFYLGIGPGQTQGPEERITETKEADELTPAIAISASGALFLAFTENSSAAPNGKLYLATN
jgi:hypothetical protein